MDTRQVLLVDAFADEPLGGLPVAVVPDGEDLSATRLRRVAGEFGAAGTVTLHDGRLTYAAREGVEGFVAGAVAGGAALVERGFLDPGAHTMDIKAGADGASVSVIDDEDTDGGGAAGEPRRTIEIDEDRTVRVPLARQHGKPTVASTNDLASVLGIDVAAIDDVSADLPGARIDTDGGTLLTPVNFLEHLSRADPSPSKLAVLLDDVGAARLCAFTFDTLGNRTDLHARVFDPAAAGGERPASGIAVGACAAHLSRHGVFDGDRESIRAECGRFLDRPGTIEATLEASPTVSGNALSVLDGDLTLSPADDGDDIIEA